MKTFSLNGQVESAKPRYFVRNSTVAVVKNSFDVKTTIKAPIDNFY